MPLHKGGYPDALLRAEGKIIAPEARSQTDSKCIVRSISKIYTRGASELKTASQQPILTTVRDSIIRSSKFTSPKIDTSSFVKLLNSCQTQRRSIPPTAHHLERRRPHAASPQHSTAQHSTAQHSSANHTTTHHTTPHHTIPLRPTTTTSRGRA